MQVIFETDTEGHTSEEYLAAYDNYGEAFRKVFSRAIGQTVVNTLLTVGEPSDLYGQVQFVGIIAEALILDLTVKGWIIQTEKSLTTDEDRVAREKAKTEKKPSGAGAEENRILSDRIQTAYL